MHGDASPVPGYVGQGETGVEVTPLAVLSHNSSRTFASCPPHTHTSSAAGVKVLGTREGRLPLETQLWKLRLASGHSSFLMPLNKQGKERVTLLIPEEKLGCSYMRGTGSPGSSLVNRLYLHVQEKGCEHGPGRGA